MDRSHGDSAGLLGAVQSALVLAACLAIVGCGGGGGGGGTPADTQGPTVSDPTVTPPATFRFTGGPVTISCKATDASEVKEVKATVTKQGGASAPQSVALAKKAGTTDQYEGTFACPGNIRSDGQAETYTVKITASDTKNHATTADASNLQIPAAPLPTTSGGSSLPTPEI